MSDSQAYEEVTISSDGVAVVKRFEDEEFPVPAIAFDFKSDRDEPVTVTMCDTVPDGIEVEDLGFHPEYGSEFWTIDDETITFEREMEAEESYTTVYGIRATGSDDVRQFLTEPTLESVEPPLPEDESNETEDILAEACEIELLPHRKKNSKRPVEAYVEYVQQVYRKKIETGFSGLKRLLPASIHAVTDRGFELKVFLFVLACSIDALL